MDTLYYYTYKTIHYTSIHTKYYYTIIHTKLYIIPVYIQNTIIHYTIIHTKQMPIDYLIRFNIFTAGNTRLKHAKHPSNYEENTSELLEYIEEMF